MAERQLPGGRAAKGRRLADFRPMPKGPAAIVVDKDGTVPERDEPETAEPPQRPPQRRTGRRASDTPQRSRPEAAGRAAAATMAEPLLAQIGRTLLEAGQLDLKLMTEHARRQQHAVRKLRRAVNRLRRSRPEDSNTVVSQQVLYRLANACYGLAEEAMRTNHALLLPMLRAARAAPAIAQHPRIIDLDPASPPARALLDAGRVAAGETDPGMERVTVVNDEDMTVVVDPHRHEEQRIEEPA